jgi:hypothetical protein
MNHTQQMYARLRFRERLDGLSGEAFEDFFHDLMCACHDDFLDVRVYGNLGDQGSDGLSLHSGKLYACYAPRSINVADLRSKFRGDLASALEKRPGQFRTFVFVHNTPRGVHPKVATMLADAQNEHPDLIFEELGRRKLWQKLLPLHRHTVEDLLKCEIPIEEPVYGIGMEDLAPLLARLKERRETADALMSLAAVSGQKLEFNGLDGEMFDDLVKGMRYTYLVHEYYAGLQDTQEHDEVAAGFAIRYRTVRERTSDNEEILLNLLEYVLGNRLQRIRDMWAGWVVVAHFFERCDIYEAPPADWVAPNGVGGT